MSTRELGKAKVLVTHETTQKKTGHRGGAEKTNKEKQHQIGETTDKTEKNNNYREILCQIAAGATAPIPKQTVVAPLDRTKIYFQTHQESYR